MPYEPFLLGVGVVLNILTIAFGVCPMFLLLTITAFVEVLKAIVAFLLPKYEYRLGNGQRSLGSLI